MNALNFHHRLVLEACMHTFLCMWKKRFTFGSIYKGDEKQILLHSLYPELRSLSRTMKGVTVLWITVRHQTFHSHCRTHQLKHCTKSWCSLLQTKLADNSLLLAPSFLWLYVAFWGCCSVELSNPLHLGHKVNLKRGTK